MSSERGLDDKAVENDDRDRPRTGIEVAEDLHPRRGLSGESKAHLVDNAVNLISHQEFTAFIEEYFAEINEERFNRLTSPSEIGHIWINKVTGFDKCYEEHHDTLVRNLTGCLIASEDMSASDPDGISGRVDTVKGTVSSNDCGSEFFVRNRVLEEFRDNYVEGLVEMYRRQVEVNNSRKRALGEELRKRLLYPAYWDAMRMIDVEIDNMFAGKKRCKRKSDCDYELMEELIEKRESFDNLFHDVSRLSEDYREYGNLFEPADNVDPRSYGIEPYDYLP